MSNELVICIGSNSNDKKWQMTNCIKWLKSFLADCKVSTIYTSKAVNGVDADYMNAVMKAKINESLQSVNEKLKQYEAICGRTPASKSEGVIPMDLDIIIWNDKVIRPKDYGHQYFQEGWTALNNK